MLTLNSLRCAVSRNLLINIYIEIPDLSNYEKQVLSLLLLYSCIGIFQSCDDEPPNNPVFFLDENGVTVKCLDCIPGDTGEVNGKTFEAVDRELLQKRISEGADLRLLCTSLVTDMNDLFYDDSTFNQDIGNWDLCNVTTMHGVFGYTF